VQQAGIIGPHRTGQKQRKHREPHDTGQSITSSTTPIRVSGP